MSHIEGNQQNHRAFKGESAVKMFHRDHPQDRMNLPSTYVTLVQLLETDGIQIMIIREQQPGCFPP